VRGHVQLHVWHSCIPVNTVEEYSVNELVRYCTVADNAVCAYSCTVGHEVSSLLVTEPSNTLHIHLCSTLLHDQPRLNRICCSPQTASRNSFASASSPEDTMVQHCSLRSIIRRCNGNDLFLQVSAENQELSAAASLCMQNVVWYHTNVCPQAFRLERAIQNWAPRLLHRDLVI
jgi:hypothetical protein